jgi:hypothetical protein
MELRISPVSRELDDTAERQSARLADESPKWREALALVLLQAQKRPAIGPNQTHLG